MYKRIFVFLIGLLSAFASNPVEAMACACCAEPGTYFLSTYKPRGFELDLIKEIRFEKRAKLYMTEAGFELVKGLDEIRKESEIEASVQTYDEFDLVNGFNGKNWRFEMRSAGGKKGLLTLPLPGTMVNYKVDIHDVEDRPNGPLLYKEYRFKGNVSTATGIFRSGASRGTTYFLVFQGRGVGCDEVSNYTHWRLEIEGPRSSYAFYGKLASGEAVQAVHEK